jgi:hypothetical protein
MSNGIRRLMADGSIATSDDQEGTNKVVYAQRFDPTTSNRIEVYEAARAAVGGARADVFATGGRFKPPGEADGKRHPRPEFSPPSAAGLLRERNANHGDKTNSILIEGLRSSTLSIHSITLVVVVDRCGLCE